MENALEDFRQERFVGFDTETRPSFRKGDKHLPCMIQAATARAVYLFRLRPDSDFRVPAELIASQQTLKVGVGLADDIRALIASAGPKYDDGSYGPLFIRLAWHCAGSYSKYDKTGGSQGAGMRFPPESQHGGNAGLHLARNLLEPIKKKYPGLTYADLYTLAGMRKLFDVLWCLILCPGTVAIAELNGPRAKWRPGRVDFAEAPNQPTPDGRLPDAAQGAAHVRAVFYRMV